MKKTILIIILVLITAGCIFYGTKKHFGNHVKFFDHGLINIELGDDGFEDEKKSDDNREESRSIDQTLEKFSNIKIDSAIMEIRLETGDNFSIQGSWNKSWLRPEVSVNNGTLNVLQKSRKRNNTGNNNCRITITIPEGSKLSDITIDSNVGEIKFRKIAAEDIHIDLNVGEISLRDVNFENVIIDNNVGEVSVDTDANLDDYEISLSSDVGQVNVNGRSYKRSYNQRGSGKNRIKIDTNVGEINLK